MGSPRVLDGGHAVHQLVARRDVDRDRAVVVGRKRVIYQMGRVVDRYSTKRVDYPFHRVKVNKCETVDWHTK